MKKLIIIGGTMGVGKTTVGRLLADKLENSIFLDGDDAWEDIPFVVNEEDKKKLMSNIKKMINGAISDEKIDNIVFVWVMSSQDVIDEIIASAEQDDVRIWSMTLIARKNVIKQRLQKDLDNGVRKDETIIESSCERLSDYLALNACLIDTSTLSPGEVADSILELVNYKRNTWHD